jgi:hypothetical protein
LSGGEVLARLGRPAEALIGRTAAGTLLILLFLPVFHAAWFWIKPTAGEPHASSHVMARSSELSAADAAG